MGIEDLGAAPWHKAMPSPIPSQHQMLEIMKPAYYAVLKSGRLRPPTYPWQFVSYFLLAGFLMIDHRHRNWLYHCRWLVWFTIIYIEYGNLMHSSSIEPAIAYMTGMQAVWGVLWSAVWLVWTRPQFTAKRVERRKRGSGVQETPKLDKKGRRKSFVGSGWELPDGKSSGTLMHSSGYGERTAPVSETETDSPDVATPRTRTPRKGDYNAATGEALKAQDINRDLADIQEKQEVELSKSKLRTADGEWEYFWQPYPSTLFTRIGWVIDLILSFRGQGWNFSIPSNPPLPPDIAESLGEPITKTLTSRVGVQRFVSRKELAKYQLPKFLACYLILDFIKLHILWDPYMRTGDMSLPAPPYLGWLPPFGQLFMRRAIQLVGIVTAIEYLELLSPLIFCLLLGPNSFLGLRGASWQYPTTWGSPHIILTRSLNGLWGGWWHQTFRLGFVAPANYLIRHNWITRKSFLGQTTALLIAFSISGFLHLSGSLSQLPHTHPLGPLQFFLLQVPGMLIQSLLTAVFAKQIQRFPRWSRRLANGLYSFIWLFLTSPSFVDDMNRGGVWMFEPLPWSPLRALGLAPNGESMWPWKGIHCAYWSSTNGRWWESGLALFL